MMHPPSLTRFAWLSIAAAVVTIGLKSGAYFLTGSVGLLSDALESGVNLIAAIVALLVLSVVARPPDNEHEYGHDKAEYFSSGVEGALILVAAASIAWTSIDRLLHPQAIEQVGLGVAASILATLVNFGVSRVLHRASREYHSITLEADAHHLMTDVWTSAGVFVAVLAIGLTGWQWLDPIIGLLVAVNIIWSGQSLVRRSIMGLLDTALPVEEHHQIETILAAYRRESVQFHELRTRQSGSRRFVDVHILVPGVWTIQRGHALLERIEAEICQALPNTAIVTHLEPTDDPASWDHPGVRADR